MIALEHVSKSYQLGVHQRSLREALTQLWRPRPKPSDKDIFWALEDINFTVPQGEVLGIIGHNGAGKSTLLKLLSDVTYPTRGRIHKQGRLAALIELGAGFHPDLTGRENVFLNGAILGLKRREIQAQFDAIVAFAEIEKFIDTPVKRYSSGMYVRLAFAVAAHVQADVLLVDEVLSVGDASFQQKSLDKMLEMREQGATVIFVSHNLWSVAAFCHRVLLLEQGHIVAEGLPGPIIQQYRQQQRQKLITRTVAEPNQDGERVIITDVEMLDEAERPQKEVDPQDSFLIRVHYLAAAPIEHPIGKIRVRRADGLLCLELRVFMETGITVGKGYYQLFIQPIQLTPDIYTVEATIIDRHKPMVYAFHSGEMFTVPGQLADMDRGGIFYPNVEGSYISGVNE